MTRTNPRLVLVAIALAVGTIVVGCGGSGADSTAGAGAGAGSGAGSAAGSAGGGGVRALAAAEAVKALDGRTVVDVRTLAEYAAGHLVGAQNVDVEAADFGTRIAALDRNAKYLVYCRTGRRSAIAAQQMKDAGFTDVVDGGGMADLVAAGAPTQ